MKKPLFLTVKISFVETLESWLTGIGLGFLVLGTIGLLVFFKQTENTFYQGVQIDNTAVGGLTKKEALELLQSKNNQNDTQLELYVDTIVVSSSSSQLAITKDYQTSINQAFEIGRSGFPLSRLKTIFLLSINPKNITSSLIANDTKLTNFIQELASQVDILGENPSVDLELSGVATSLVVNKGSVGRKVNREKTKDQIQTALSTNTSLETIRRQPAFVASTAAVLNDEEITKAKERATYFVGTTALFSVDQVTLSLNDQQLISLLTFPNGVSSDMSEILTTWDAKIAREAQEPTFIFDEETLLVEEFTPPKNGLKLKKEEAAEQIKKAIEEIEITRLSYANQSFDQNVEQEEKNNFDFPLPVQLTSPKKSLAATNNLGITELIGFGDSEYDHSIPTRIHNVSLASDLITNKILAPGEEYSFNKEIGEVSRRTGFQPAYVISGGKTILGDGGGVCQVSTTLFRSVLDAGLEVTNRRQHSYRVSYYELNEKPGIDATVYSGDVDLRFINDTDHHILVHSQADPNDLYMSIELYGTSDGRQTEITSHEVWDFRPPPPPVYSDDTSIPTGVIKQVDWAVSGVKTRFVNQIKDKDGTVIREDEYYSNYVPWSAKYIRGV